MLAKMISRSVLAIILVPVISHLLLEPATALSVTGQDQIRYWQLTVSYTESTFEIISADIIPPMLKTPVTPGSEFPLVRVDYELDWLDASGVVSMTVPISIPLGTRAILAEGAICTPAVPPVGIVVLRVPGPADESSVSRARFRRTLTPIENTTGLSIPKIFESSQFERDLIRTPVGVSPPAGPRSSWKAQDNGPDSKRLVVVVMGDGYTAANLDAGIFENHVNQFLGWMPQKEPWNNLWNGTNIYAVEIESNQEGSDQDGNVNGGPPGTFVDTYLHTSYWFSGIERLNAMNNPGPQRAIDAANSLVGVGVWDYIFVLVNSTKYGASGGSMSVTAMSSLAPEVVPHEWGHTFAGVTDEYGGSSTGSPPSDNWPNIDFDSAGPGLKWLPWVEQGIPLPTPDVVAYDNFMGAFEGGRYFNQGIYRPFRRCLMNFLFRPYCSVCQEQTLRVFANRIDFADSIISPNSLTVTGDGATLGIVPYDLYDSLEYEWTLNGVVNTTSNGPTLFVANEDVVGPFNPLLLKVTYVTPKVRLGDLTRSFFWFLSSGDCCNTPGDANNDGGFNISDITYGISRIFAGGPAPPCQDEADADGNNAFNIADITFGIARIFAAGPAPVCGASGT